MSDDEFSFDALGRYLRDEGTEAEKAAWAEKEREWERKKGEWVDEQMRLKREGFTYGEDDLSLETRPPTPRILKPEEMQPPQPKRHFKRGH